MVEGEKYIIRSVNVVYSTSIDLGTSLRSSGLGFSFHILSSLYIDFFFVSGIRSFIYIFFFLNYAKVRSISSSILGMRTSGRSVPEKKTSRTFPVPGGTSRIFPVP